MIDELYVDAADGPVSRVHLGVQGRATAPPIDRFHAAGLAAGGRRQRRPGRAQLPPGLLRRLPARPRRQQHRGRLPRAGTALAPPTIEITSDGAAAMTHRSCLAGFIIDCETDDLAGAADFWAAALGDRRRRKPQGKYVKLDHQAGLHVEVQKVDHPPRVHLDIESDDVAAEVARLERLGARRVAAVRTWVVMEAPTGHRFCVIRAQTPDFEARARTWEDGD